MEEMTQIASESFANYNVIDVVDPVDFVNATTDGYGNHDECVTVVPREDGTVAFLRLTESLSNGADENARIATVVDARFVARSGTRKSSPSTPKSITYHGTDAATVLTWVRSLARERSVADVAVEYYPQNNSQLIEDAGLDFESLFLRYTTDSDRTQEVAVEGPYANPIQMSANF